VTALTRPNGVGPAAHVLLLLTLLLIAVQPLGTVAGGVYSRLVLAAVLIGGVAAVRGTGRLFVVGVTLAVPALALLVAGPEGGLGTLGLVLAIATIGFVMVVLLRAIFFSDAVSAASVSASLVVYLLMGITWWLAYMLVEALVPGSFYGLAGLDVLEIRRELFYYSYVTLTTVGYGDIGPVSNEARSLAITQAVVGQLYLVVLVASLVSQFLSERQTAERS
jgi:hypothetical protein